MKHIEIHFGAKDSENKGWEYTIPAGMEAVIEDGKVIVREKESEDERIRKTLIHIVKGACDKYGIKYRGEEISEEKLLDYLEKQKEQKPLSTEETELNSVAFLEQMGYTCIPPKKEQKAFSQEVFDAAKHEALWEEQKPILFIPKFRVGDKIISTKNPHLTYSILEVGHINELGNPEYKVEIFQDNEPATKHNIHYMECRNVDEWGKLIEQRPAEWSEEDEVYLQDALWCVKQASKVARGENDMGTCWSAERWLKSLRPQPRGEIYQTVKHDLAIKFMNYLDENRPEGKMNLSNGECEDIDKAFQENDWAKILRYIEKYGK